MLFHVEGVYGGRATEATAVVDAVFAAARRAFPRIFSQDSRLEPARQAKFEHVCVFLAAAMAEIGQNAPFRRAVLEEMVDRLEVGLREAGVGDMSIGRQVRDYAAAMNGRILRYEPLILNDNSGGFEDVAAGHGVSARPALLAQKGLADGGKLG